MQQLNAIERQAIVEASEIATGGEVIRLRRPRYDENGERRIFRRLRARWLRWQKPRRRK